VSPFIDKLRSIVGDKGLIIDDAGKHPYLTDWRDNYLGTALAVVRPASTEEVAGVVKLCAAEKVAIVPQGGNTGLVGGGMPHEDGCEIVLSLGRMNRILEIDEIGYSMTVEAGVILKTIQETAAAHDRLFSAQPRRRRELHHRRQPLDQRRRRAGAALRQHPPSGPRPRSGHARRRGLEWLRALKKDNTGYDLRDLYLGAEGTLGIITKAVLKLWPKPKDIATSWIAVPSPQAAVELLSGAMPPRRTTSPPAS
jgi:FAD/FMN-containing dehydrogenase